MRQHRRGLGRACRGLAGAAVAGVVITALLAWALAALLPHRGLTKRFNTIRPVYDDRVAMVWVTEYSRPGMIRREWAITRGTPPAFSIAPLGKGEARRAKADTRASYRWGLLAAAVRENPPPRTVAVEDARGWPVPAFWCEVSPAAISGESPLRVGGFTLPAGWGTHAPESIRILPWRPIWRGAAIDAGFWAGVWLAAGAVFRVARRRVRSRRGRCPSCGYDLRRDLAAGCPECGWRRDAVRSDCERLG